ncbi:hypothetical protein BC828DRAFT_414035, partial [Blastocladiella britannica]
MSQQPPPNVADVAAAVHRVRLLATAFPAALRSATRSSDVVRHYADVQAALAHLAALSGAEYAPRSLVPAKKDAVPTPAPTAAVVSLQPTTSTPGSGSAAVSSSPLALRVSQPSPFAVDIAIDSFPTLHATLSPAHLVLTLDPDPSFTVRSFMVSRTIAFTRTHLVGRSVTALLAWAHAATRIYLDPCVVCGRLVAMAAESGSGGPGLDVPVVRWTPDRGATAAHEECLGSQDE